MKKITIGIIAHVDSGKTTLSEALLYLTGTIRNFGRVDKGASFFDSDHLERQRGITIYSKQARFQVDDTEFTLIDTPGHADFSAEMERTLKVLDYAILLISASDGIKGQTETLWRLLAEYHIPTFLFFNKMDQDGADRTVLFHTFRTTFTDNVIDFSDVMREVTAHSESSASAIESLGDSPAAARVYDSAAMCAEDVMEEFLETGAVCDATLRQMIQNRELFPCFFGSALKIEGVQEFIHALARFTEPVVYPEPFSARVYKISRDADGSRLTFLKVTGGALKNKTTLPDGEGQSKINQIRFYNGNRFTLKNEALAGEVCAVTGLKESYAGQGFGAEHNLPAPLMIPILRYRVLLPSDVDAVRALPYFRTLEEEHPELTVDWEETGNEISVCVMGEVQLEVLTALLKERFDLSVSFDQGSVMYQETIGAPVIGSGHFEPLRHYAEVHLLLEPLERGSGLVFDSAVSTDLLAKNWQRLILTHLRERVHRGVLTGSPITDMRITVIAGKAHLKHTEGGDFRQAVYRAVRQGLMMAETILLEPYYRFVMELPSSCVGRAMNDLSQMHAQFQLPEIKQDPVSYAGEVFSVITGRGPVSLLRAYPRDLASYTQGRGRISFANDGYDLCGNANDVVEARGYDPLTDVRNTPDSVFCSHGSGMVVPYDQVYDYMDILKGVDPQKLLRAAVSNRESEDESPESSASLRGVLEAVYEASQEGMAAQGHMETSAQRNASIGTEEIDAIISRISRSNSKDKKQGNTWKKKFGEKDKSGATGGSSLPAGKSAGPSSVFALEEAQYLVVDGYNVIFAWPELSELSRVNIDSARDALIDILSNLQSMITGEVMVVYDAYRVKGHATEQMQLQNICIVYTGEEETADQYIEKFTNAHGRKSRIVVVTSDGLEQLITRGQGCMLISSRELRDYIDRLSQNLRDRFQIKEP